MSSRESPAKVGVASATALVIANMIGTGVFTSLGFQLVDIKNASSVLLLWVIGAVAALCGAMVYGELGAAMPRSGAEYHYLSKIYHPAVGFLSGWISLTVAFPAPAALSSMAFGAYASRVFHFGSPMTAALVILCVLTLLHCSGIRQGTTFQNVSTAINVVLIAAFVVCGLFLSPHRIPVSLLPGSSSAKDILSPAFAVSLVYVSYAYSGWNASAYVAGEMDHPQKWLPISLVSGTLIVAVLYLLLNYSFLATASVDELAGQIEVAYISARNIFGPTGVKIIGCVISLLLISSASSLIFIGPRITQVMGEDMPVMAYFAMKTRKGVPLRAMVFQFLISLAMIVTSSFEKALTYVGFTFSLFTVLTVFGIFVHRHRFRNAERPYRTWGYPLVPLVFIAITLWNLVYLLMERPVQSIGGLVTVMSGLIVYYLGKRAVVSSR